jgi:putative phosphoesterase
MIGVLSDTHGPTALLPATEAVELDGRLIYMLHSLTALDLKPEAAGIAVVISGHSHKPKIEVRNGILYLNPGSAGPRRFQLPITVARLHLDATLRAEIVTLSIQD